MIEKQNQLLSIIWLTGFLEISAQPLTHLQPDLAEKNK